MREDLLKLVLQDDVAVDSALALEEERKQTSLLQGIKDAVTSKPFNAQRVVKVDLNVAHTSTEIFNNEQSPAFIAMTITALGQEIDYWYELDRGERVYHPAGLMLNIGPREIKHFYLTNSDTTEATLELVFGGVDTTK